MTEDQIVLRPLAQNPVELPALVREFCQQNNFSTELRIAADLARKHFRATAVIFEIDTDQETGEKYVVIIVAMSVGSREEALASYFAYVKELVKTLPWPLRNLIRLSYHLS